MNYASAILCKNSMNWWALALALARPEEQKVFGFQQDFPVKSSESLIHCDTRDVMNDDHCLLLSFVRRTGA